MLVSGAGTNLQALIRASEAPDFPGRLAMVVSNRRDAGALQIARQAGIVAIAVPVSDHGGDSRHRDLAMRDALVAAGVRLVVCAGYNRILCDDFLAAFPDAILNLHPSLLPAFGGGMSAVDEALAHGVKVTGCTVHFLEPGGTDGGAIVLQSAVPVYDGDDADTLRTRVHQEEWRILPDAVRLWCQGRLHREGRRVRIDPASVRA